MSKVRWGIIGPGDIANRFADALKTSFSGELKGFQTYKHNELVLIAIPKASIGIYCI